MLAHTLHFDTNLFIIFSWKLKLKDDNITGAIYINHSIILLLIDKDNNPLKEKKCSSNLIQMSSLSNWYTFCH